MARILVFDKLGGGMHTFYEDLETGAPVNVYPGDRVPAAKMANPDHYVELGIATSIGEDDGSEGTVELILEGIRSVFAQYAPLEGPRKSWEIAAMMNKLEDLELEASDARKAYAAAEAARLESEK